MAKHFNTWTPGEHNGLRDPYWKGWDLWRFPVPTERNTAVDVSKIPCGLYRRGLMYINLMVRVDSPVDEQRTRRSITRELKDLFKVRKCISVADTQKIAGKQKWLVLYQFYCRLAERPTEDVMNQVEKVANAAVEFQEDEEC